MAHYWLVHHFYPLFNSNSNRACPTRMQSTISIKVENSHSHFTFFMTAYIHTVNNLWALHDINCVCFASSAGQELWTLSKSINYLHRKGKKKKKNSGTQPLENNGVHCMLHLWNFQKISSLIAYLLLSKHVCAWPWRCSVRGGPIRHLQWNFRFTEFSYLDHLL